MAISKKSGYEITEHPYEMTSLLDGDHESQDASDDTVNFQQDPNNYNLVSGSTLSVLFGKLKNLTVNLKRVATSGDYNDLINTPEFTTPDVTASASVGSGTGTPSVVVTKTGQPENPNFDFSFNNLKGTPGRDGAPGHDGAPGADGVTPIVNATATVDNTTGTPAVVVTESGTPEDKTFNFAFTGLKGESGGGGGTTDYDDLINKPSIGGVTLTGNKTLAELGYVDEIVPITQDAYNALEIAGEIDPNTTYFIIDAESGPVLGTAASKNYTDLVRPNNHDLVESNAVYAAISSAISSVYTPHGDLSVAQLTSDLLISENVGNLYTMTDSGYTTDLFIQGSGVEISAGDSVGIIVSGPNIYKYNLMPGIIDLHTYQKKELDTPVTVGGIVRSTVQTAISAIVDVIDGMNIALSQVSSSLGSLTGRVVTLESVKIKRKTVDIGGIAINQGGGSTGIYYKDNVDLGLTDSEFLVSVTWAGAWSEDVLLVPNTRKLGLTTRVSGKVIPSGRTVNVYYI